jgi:hypothetical protein
MGRVESIRRAERLGFGRFPVGNLDEPSQKRLTLKGVDSMLRAPAGTPQMERKTLWIGQRLFGLF